MFTWLEDRYDWDVCEMVGGAEVTGALFDD